MPHCWLHLSRQKEKKKKNNFAQSQCELFKGISPWNERGLSDLLLKLLLQPGAHNPIRASQTQKLCVRSRRATLNIRLSHPSCPQWHSGGRTHSFLETNTHTQTRTRPWGCRHKPPKQTPTTKDMRRTGTYSGTGILPVLPSHSHGALRVEASPSLIERSHEPSCRGKSERYTQRRHYYYFAVRFQLLLFRSSGPLPKFSSVSCLRFRVISAFKWSKWLSVRVAHVVHLEPSLIQ